MKLHPVVLCIVTVVWHQVASSCWGFLQVPLSNVGSVSHGSHRHIVEGRQWGVSTLLGSQDGNFRSPFLSMIALGLATSDPDEKGDETPAPSADESETIMTREEEQVKSEAVGNLVVNDEWEGLTMELTEVIRTAVMEDIKANAREFLGKDNYQIGDFSKEIDARVKTEVANLRGKENYELGDLVLVMDTMAKNMTSDLTGKPYVAGDLSIELDKRIKKSVAKFCGKSEYQFGDLSKEIDKRVKDRVAAYLKKDRYEIGDISKEIEKSRRAWVKDFLGEDAAKEYKFGDITKKALSNFTGKDTYQFGDLTKKLMGSMFKKKS